MKDKNEPQNTKSKAGAAMLYRRPEALAPVEEVAQSSGQAQHSGNRALTDEAEQPGESSGNAASNRTTQKLEDASEATGEASTQLRPFADDLHALSKRGYSIAPRSLIGRPASSGVAVAHVNALQNSWVKYNGKSVGRGNIWLASNSPACLAAQAQQAQAQLHQIYHQGPVMSAQPPAATAAIPPSPFLSASSIPAPSQAILQRNFKPDAAELGSNESETVQKSRHTQDLHRTIKPCHSDPDSRIQSGEASIGIARQLSLPDFEEMDDLWNSLPQDSLGLENLLGKQSLLRWNSIQGSIGVKMLQNTSLARFDRDHGLPFSSLLQDVRTQRRNKSLRLQGTVSWQPEQFAPLNEQQQASPQHAAAAIKPSQAPCTPLPSWTSLQGHNYDLPEQIEMSLITAPSMFGLPTCINKSFKPAFTVRVTINCAKQLDFPVTVSVYALQKEQVAKLDQWQPSLHVFTDSLSGLTCSETIHCDGPLSSQLDTIQKFSSSAYIDLAFNDLKFNNSSRMKPRWLVFAMTLPTDDLMFIQYTVPTVVMSRQCDQTPRALAILQGETPTRKRTRQGEVIPPRPISAQWGQVPASLREDYFGMPSYGTEMDRPFASQRGTEMINQTQIPPQIQWPTEGPYVMSKWREAIQRVCRALSLTRSFEQEDMHELAKIAGFVGSAGSGIQGNSTLSETQWNRFGSWFLSYLRVLRQFKGIWMHPTIKIICGFSVTRDRAAYLLRGQPNQTFILRPSLSLEGTFVISVMKQGAVHHLAIDGEQLQHRSLVEWISVLEEIQFLLDIDSGRRYHKHQLFGNMHMALPGRAPHPYAAGPMPPNMDYPALMPQTGQDALAQILELSRRGSGTLQGPLQPGALPHMLSLGRGGPPFNSQWAHAAQAQPHLDQAWLTQRGSSASAGMLERGLERGLPG